MYHYAGNNPVRYIDPDGRTGENGLDDIAAFRLEDPIPAKSIPLYDSSTGTPILDNNGEQIYYDSEIDTVLAKSGELIYGDYDGAMDKNENFYKVTARNPISVSFKTVKDNIEFASGFEELKNNAGDFLKEKLKDGKLKSGYYPKNSEGAKYLKEKWGKNIEDDVGSPSEWSKQYNSNVQYSLRKYQKDCFIQLQKMNMIMFRTGSMY